MTTLWGRRRQIPELRARNYQVRTLGERLAVNTVIQGTAADIIKLAMVRCHARARGAGPADAPAPHDPRRAAVRRPARGGRRRARADRARDVRRVGARPAAGRRHRRRAQLAGGEVSEPRPLRGRCSASAPAASSACRRRSTRAWARPSAALQAATFSFLVGTARAGADRLVLRGGLGEPRQRRRARPGGRSSAGCSAPSTSPSRSSPCARSAPAG